MSMVLVLFIPFNGCVRRLCGVSHSYVWLSWFFELSPSILGAFHPNGLTFCMLVSVMIALLVAGDI